MEHLTVYDPITVSIVPMLEPVCNASCCNITKNLILNVHQTDFT